MLQASRALLTSTSFGWVGDNPSSRCCEVWDGVVHSSRDDVLFASAAAPCAAPGAYDRSGYLIVRRPILGDNAGGGGGGGGRHLSDLEFRTMKHSAAGHESDLRRASDLTIAGHTASLWLRRQRWRSCRSHQCSHCEYSGLSASERPEIWLRCSRSCVHLRLIVGRVLLARAGLGRVRHGPRNQPAVTTYLCACRCDSLAIGPRSTRCGDGCDALSCRCLTRFRAMTVPRFLAATFTAVCEGSHDLRRVCAGSISAASSPWFYMVASPPGPAICTTLPE